MRKLLRRPSPAMIVACIALLVALGGTSVAAVSQIGRNTVGTAQLRTAAVTRAKIRNNAITSVKVANAAVTRAKIRNNAITSVKVANRSLLRADFAPGQLPAGPTGPQGPAGAAGAAGPAGPAGVIGAITVRTSSVSVDGGTASPENGQYNSARVTRLCEGSERAISAGTSWSDDAADRELVTGEIEPLLTNNQVTGYVAVGLNDSGNDSTFTLHVLCYTP